MKNDTPGISVIMPAYNAERFITQAIDSILAQTYPHFELIIIDDGSSDNTATIASQYADRDPRVTLIQQARGGVSRASNTGLHAARWDWVARMDADDVALPQRLEMQISAALHDPGVIVWGSHAYQINISNKVIGLMEHGPTSDDEYEAMRASGEPFFILNPTSLFRRDIALQVGGYNTALVAAADEELWSRMAPHGSMRVIPQKLLYYRIHSDSMTSNHMMYQQQVHAFVQARNLAWMAGDDLSFPEFQAQQRQIPWPRQVLLRAQTQGAFHYRQAGLLLSAGRRGAAIGALALALLFHPRFTISRTWMRLLNQRRLSQEDATERYISRKM